MGTLESLVAVVGLGLGWWVVSCLMSDRTPPSDDRVAEPVSTSGPSMPASHDAGER